MNQTIEKERIRRVGEPEEEIKIYLEEKCEGLLTGACETVLGEMQVFGLMGQEFRVGDQCIILIKRILECAESPRGSVQQMVQAISREEYPRMTRVGWGLNQPGYGTAEVWRFAPMQEKYFAGSSLFLLMDGEKGERSFYLWEEGTYRRLGGYFCYKEADPRPVELPFWEDETEAVELWQEEEVSAAGAATAKAAEPGPEGHDSLRGLTSLASILLLVCLVMGMLLFNNMSLLDGIEDKLNDMTEQIEQIHTGVFGEE